MPELTPTGAVALVERQVRRVRRRKNLYELQWLVYWTVVACGLAAIVLLPLALFAPAETFAIAAWSALVALVVAIAALVRGARRRWLSRAATVAWVETRGALAGRVRTLLELGRRPALSTGFFHPLLVSEVHATFPAWTPARLVPRRVPGRALGSAVAVVLVLVALVHLATLASPTPSSLGTDTRPGGAQGDERSPAAAEGAVGDRVVTAPGAPGRAPRPNTPRGGSKAPSPLTQYSSALQEDVRERVWGKAWERVRDALARAGSNAALEADDAAAREELEAGGTEDAEVADREGRAGKRHGGSDGEDADAEHAEDAPAKPETNTAANDASGDQGSSGAGNGTSPGDLFTGSAVDTAGDDASFELSLAARMRSDKAGRRQAAGPPPDADPDTRPKLADDQRREAAAHRMTVPAAYEQVVREVFAHREEP